MRRNWLPILSVLLVAAPALGEEAPPAGKAPAPPAVPAPANPPAGQTPPAAASATAPAAEPAPATAPESTATAAPATTEAAVTATAPAPAGQNALSSFLDPSRPAAFLVGVRVGGVFPQAFNKLDANFLVEVGVAYQLPVLGRRLGLFVDAGYTQPTSSGTRNDPRVMTNGGEVTWDMTVRDLGVSAGVQLVQPFGMRVLVYGGVGYKVHFTDTVIDQRAGSTDLGRNNETSTRHGAVVRIGAGYRLGPGALVLEVHYEYTPVDHLITGDENTAHLSAQLGYTLFL